MEQLNVQAFGADPTGATLATVAIQTAIDQGAEKGQVVYVPKGVYLVGSLFLRNHSQLHFEEGATLLGSPDIQDYPEVFARVAGVEMDWPAAILNGLAITDVSITGKGIIDGQGPLWWALYWGQDQTGGKRAEFDAQGLRWIADYAIKRPRALLFQGSKDLHIADITLQRSGFWNLQLTYCENVLVNGIKIHDNHGPSTDGIDIDSSRHVRVTECHLACGDDCIAVKSGRDGDGRRVNLPSEDIEVDHCHVYSGYGITIGSEVAGSVRNVRIHDNVFENSDCGLRMKSSKERGGVIEDIHVNHLTMKNVQFPFSWIMDWHNAYNRKDLTGLADMPKAWQAVAAEIPESEQMTLVKDVVVENVVATLSPDYTLPARAFDLVAFPEKPMTDVVIRNCQLTAKEFGRIEAVTGLVFDQVTVSVAQGNQGENDSFDNR